MSKVVFVGNVPYNMGEDQLIDVFKSVGQVVGFRLVFDRDTGKPRGYGFCEFADHETAASAVRNLNNTDVGGRPLRIDLADSDPFLEGKTTVRGELIDGGIPGPGERERDRYYGHGGGSGHGSGGGSGGGHERGGGGGGGGSGGGAFMANLPPGIPVPMGATSLDTISQTLATMNPGQLMEVLAQMKAFVITHPEKARALLVAHPQLAYALFQALLLNEIVDPAILQRMLAATSLSNPPPKPTPTPSVPPPQHHPYTNTNTNPFPPPPTQSPYQQSLPFQPQRPNPPPPPPSISSSQSQNLPPHMNMGMGMGMSHLSSYPSPSPSSHGGLAHTHMGPPPPSMIPPASAMFSHQQQQQQQQQGGGLPGPYGYRPPLPPQQQQQQGSTQPQQSQQQQQQGAGAGAPADVSAIDPAQRAMLMQVLSMTPDQISALPPTEREAIQVLRNQFMGGIAT